MTIIGAAPEAASSPAADADLIKDGADQSFQADVLDASQTTPVIVDFWAPWCGPCKTLQPALEQAVRKMRGKVKLVKINIDEHPHIAGQLRVQSIPAVFAFDQGRPVDGFAGALPPSEVARFVERLAAGGGAAQQIAEAIDAAGQALDAGDVGGAAQVYAQILQAEPGHAGALAGMARCYLAQGDTERARSLLDSAPEEAAKDTAIQSARAALELAESVGDTGDAATLARQLEGAPDDQQTRFDLAEALAARGNLPAAVDHFLHIITAERDWNDGAARTALLKLFEAAGPTAPITIEGRRRLSTLLFS